MFSVIEKGGKSDNLYFILSVNGYERINIIIRVNLWDQYYL
jgi:hypothetical protein